MARKLIGWMIFQILVGIWLFISPYVLDFRDNSSASIDCMVFGIVVILVAVGISLFNEQVCTLEHQEKRTS